MKFILLLIIASIIIYITYVYFSNEQAKLKHKILVLAQYNEKLKKELSINKTKKISAKFSIPINYSGILGKNTNIYLSPLINSPIINKNKVQIQVNIIDECTLYDVTWFYIILPIDSDENCHGWVKKNDFTMLCSTVQDIDKIQ
ncbi:MAG: hypothetical protein E7213_11215 [Clostridium sp.]|nr:hypothetical protein [Clostridium sp.]